MSVSVSYICKQKSNESRLVVCLNTVTQSPRDQQENINVLK